MSKEHEVKTWPVHFHHRRRGFKLWEFRCDDRDYKAGDTLWEREWDPEGGYYTGFELRGTRITYVTRGGVIPDGYCILSLEAPGTDDSIMRDMAGLLRELLDFDDCEYDHNDLCQAHGVTARPCPHYRGKEMLRINKL